MKWALHRGPEHVRGRAYFAANGRPETSRWRRFCILPLRGGYRVTMHALDGLRIIRYFNSWRDARACVEQRGT